MRSRYFSFISRLSHPPTASQPFLRQLTSRQPHSERILRSRVDIDRSCRYLALAIASSNESKQIQPKPYRGLISKEGNGRRTTHHKSPSQVIVTSTVRWKSIQSERFESIHDRGSSSGQVLRFREVAFTVHCHAKYRNCKGTCACLLTTPSNHSI